VSKGKTEESEKTFADSRSTPGVGSRVRIARAHRKQADFAALLGIKRTSLSEVETGHAAPSLKLLSRVAEVAGCSMDWLMGAGGTAGADPPRDTGSPPSRGPGVARQGIWLDGEEVRRPGGLYADHIPVLGYYAEGGILEDPAADRDDDLEYFIQAGNWPSGCVAMILLTESAGFGSGAVLVLGPEERALPRRGFGLLRCSPGQGCILAAWNREGKTVKMFRQGYAAGTLPVGSVASARLFLAHF